jgi:hypothetical protein
MKNTAVRKDLDRNAAANALQQIHSLPQHRKQYQRDHNYFKRHPELKPDCCPKCGNTEDMTFHHHIYDGSREGEWVCRDCHDKEHGFTPQQRPYSPLQTKQVIEESGFSECVKKYEKHVCRFIKSHVRDQQASEELTQDVLIAFWQNQVKTGWQAELSLPSYLFGIAEYKIKDHYKAIVKGEKQVEAERDLDKWMGNPLTHTPRVVGPYDYAYLNEKYGGETGLALGFDKRAYVEQPLNPTGIQGPSDINSTQSGPVI